MTVNRLARSILAGAALLALCAGCATANLIREVEHGKPRFDDHAGRLWNGKYMPFGECPDEVTRDGRKYLRCVFDRAVDWPRSPAMSSKTSLEVLLPVGHDGEPLLSAVGETDRRETMRRSVLYIHTRPELDLEALPEEFAAWWNNRVPRIIDRATMYSPRDYPTILVLQLEEEGVGSKLVAGQPDGERFVWRGPYECRTRPAAYSGEWWSPLDRFMYAGMVLTVPIDVVTSPVQLCVGLFWYVVYRGMSPK